MSTEYSLKLALTLRPVGHPWVRVTVNDQTNSFVLANEKIIEFEQTCVAGSGYLRVEHFDKAENDADTAVIIESISFFGISDPRFVWAGSYVPQYPEHYPDKQPLLMAHSYLGWNGIYTLNFEIPIFSWIHQTLNLGWLYN